MRSRHFPHNIFVSKQTWLSCALQRYFLTRFHMKQRKSTVRQPKSGYLNLLPVPRIVGTTTKYERNLCWRSHTTSLWRLYTNLVWNATPTKFLKLNIQLIYRYRVSISQLINKILRPNCFIQIKKFLSIDFYDSKESFSHVQILPPTAGLNTGRTTVLWILFLGLTLCILCWKR